MGYELKLIIGESSTLSEPELKRGKPELAGEYVHRPALKDENGECITTGRLGRYFSICAEVNLCKPGEHSCLFGLDSINTDEKNFWFWYCSDGNTRECTDKYDTQPKPVPIQEVLEALEEDIEEQPYYRRSKWAAGLLRAMLENDGSHLEVLLYGY